MAISTMDLKRAHLVLVGQLREANARADEAERRLGEAMEALKPFALAEGRYVNATDSDDRIVTSYWPRAIDLRRAAALSPEKPE